MGTVQDKMEAVQDKVEAVQDKLPPPTPVIARREAPKQSPA
jgi:hypothetical protein